MPWVGITLVNKRGKKRWEDSTGDFKIQMCIFVKVEAMMILMCLGDRYIEISTLVIDVGYIILSTFCYSQNV